jgi:hypothetical protein
MHGIASCADQDTARCLVRIWSRRGMHVRYTYFGQRQGRLKRCRPEKRKVGSSILPLTTGPDQHVWVSEQGKHE